MADVTTTGTHRGRFGDNRVKAALLLAGFEGLLLLFGRLSYWLVIVVSIPLILTYMLRGRRMTPGFGRDLLWVVATAQALVLAAAIAAFFIGLLILILLAVFAGIAIALIYFDRPRGSG